MAKKRDTPRHPRVLVFTSPTCGYCNAVKQYLRQKRIRFKEVDVSRDQHAARDMMRRSGQMGVPQIHIGRHVVVGFDRPKLNKLLGIH